MLSSVEAMIDEAGKAQGAEYKSKLDVILTLRKKARDDLDALKDRLSPSRNY